MIAYFDHSEKLNNQISSFFFRTEQKLDYLAGQYSDIYLPTIEENRWYTLSSSPTEELISITTKFQTPISGFKKTLNELQKNQEINFSAPIGDFVLPKDPATPIVYISGGIGITPVRSIIKSLSDTHEKRNIQLIYAVAKPSDFVYMNLFQGFVDNLLPIVTRPDKSWTGASGKLSVGRALSLASKSPKTMYFVSGPQQMVETIAYGLAAALPKNQIIMDYFPGYDDI